MIGWIRSNAVALAIGGSLLLAGVSGGLAAVALGSSTASAPTKTTTINVGTGETGPAGPPGPAGPAGPPGPEGGGGPQDCPTGSVFEAVKINAPGGQVTIWTCVAT